MVNTVIYYFLNLISVHVYAIIELIEFERNIKTMFAYLRHASLKGKW